MTNTYLRTLIVLVAGLGFSACATTNTPKSMNAAKVEKTTVAPAQKLAQTEADEEDPMICETVAVTGQIRPKKVCIRKSVREARRQDGRNSLDGIQRSALSSCIPNASGACGG